jgi:hypothetical protein
MLAPIAVPCISCASLPPVSVATPPQRGAPPFIRRATLVGEVDTCYAGPARRQGLGVPASWAYSPLARLPEEQLTLDVTGHYARPDVFGPTRKR